AQLARELGIPRNRLYKWKQQLDDYGANAFPGRRGRPAKPEESELTALRVSGDSLPINTSVKRPIRIARW
ncbi:MAG: transposase, partial [Pseudomonadales bacterium]